MTERLHAVVNGLNDAGQAHWQFATAMFFQVCVLAMILLVLDVLLLRKTRAAIRYGIWSLVLVKLLLPVSLGSPISLSHWLPEIATPSERVSASVAELPTSPRINDGSVVVPTPLSPIRRKRVDQNPSAPLPAAEPRFSYVAESTHAMVERRDIESADAAIQSAVTEPLPSLRWQAWVLLAWFTVVLALGLYVLRRARQVWRLVSEAGEAPGEMQTSLEDCLARAGLKGRNIELRIVEELGSPAICGFWRPTILMPSNLVGRLDNEQLRFIFMHEICHWQRFDMHVNCLQTLLQVFYFYNPLVWVTNAFLRRTREQAVDEAVLVLLKSPSVDYGETLLDVASLQRDASTFSLRLVGVVESRKALTGRVRRILTRPLPKTARLGVTGIGAMLLSGMLLLPMAGREEPKALAGAFPVAIAIQPEDGVPTEIGPTTEAGEATSGRTPSKTPAVLTGRLSDETGAPVDDATIKLECRQPRERIQVKTDEEGRYRLESIKQAGEFQVSIESEGWVGIRNWEDKPRIRLAPNSSVERDFQLQRACPLRVHVVDEQGNPVKRVHLLAAPLADQDWRCHFRTFTDGQGRVTIGGLPPSESEYIVATMHNDYGFSRLTVTLTDPAAVVEREIILRKGDTVTGKAICSDGEPPAGWRIGAMPSWWRFGISQSGSAVADDGSFSLPHILPGPYDVMISIPNGESGSSPRRVLENSELIELPQPLKIKLDHPSPASLVFITGRVEHSAGSDENGFWIFANETERQGHSSFYLRPGKSEFKIGPVIKGTYRLTVSDTKIEMKEMRVTAPAENVVLQVAAKGLPKLSGVVVDGVTNKPVSDFRLRVIKLRTLKGPNFVEDSTWREFSDKGGRFETTVAGPGIYQLLATAEGYSWVRSDPINTEQDSGKPLTLTLTKGVSLAGTVVDEEGRPVDGAQVIPLSKAAGTMPRVMGQFATTDGATLTNDGRFELTKLPGDKETLKVTHPDFCFTIVEDIDVDATRQNPLKVTLTRGGTVRGQVYDATGQPEPNVTLYFQDDFAYGGMDREVGRFATAVTDENGAYEVQHLPEQLCHIQRAEEWNSLGVVRHCVLPKNGHVSKVDLGGKARLTGRLLANGNPLSQTRLLIAGENPTFGIFKAYTTTDGDGKFVFHGIAPGDRSLYYALPGRRNEWGRVHSIRVTSDDADLGDIDHITGTLTVNLPPADVPKAAGLRLSLIEYNPIWTHGNRSGVLARRERPDEPFVFEQIPLGRHELVGYRTGQFQTRQIIEMTADSLEQQVMLQLPAGTASLRGKIDGELCGPGGCQSFKLWSRNRQLLRTFLPDDQGVYQLDSIPAGDYLVCEKDIRNAPVLMEISLGEGEQRTVDFTPTTISPDQTCRGFLMVRVLTPDGIPLPCDFVLNGSEGELTPNSSQHACLHFTGVPGTYSLVVAYPGFKPLRRQVELMPVGADGQAQGNFDVQVQLEPDAP